MREISHLHESDIFFSILIKCWKNPLSLFPCLQKLDTPSKSIQWQNNYLWRYILVAWKASLEMMMFDALISRRFLVIFVKIFLGTDLKERCHCSTFIAIRLNNETKVTQGKKRFSRSKRWKFLYPITLLMTLCTWKYLRHSIIAKTWSNDKKVKTFWVVTFFMFLPFMLFIYT